MPVGDCSKDAGDEEFCAGLDVFLVAGRAEPAGFAREGEERVESAVVTADACETAFEGAAFEEFVDDLRDGGPQRPLARLIVVRVTGEEGGKVAMGALPEGGFARITCPVDVHAPETRSELEGGNVALPLPSRLLYFSSASCGNPLRADCRNGASIHASM